MLLIQLNQVCLHADSTTRGPITNNNDNER